MKKISMKAGLSLFLLLSFFTLATLSTSFFLISCSSSTESKTETVITITDVWFTDFIDNDQDGYYSNAFLNFDLAVNKNSANVMVRLGIREADPMDASGFTICFESTSLEILGDSEDNIWYIPLSAISYTIMPGEYDFMLQVSPASNPGNVVAEKKPSTDPDLSGIRLEPITSDLVEEWVSYIDDDICETYFTYYPRQPIGAGYYALAERFPIPEGVSEVTVKQAAIYIPYLYQNPIQVSVSIYSDDNNLPDELIHSETLYNITSTGWKTLDLNYAVDWAGAFYLSVAPSLIYALGVDDNSSVNNGVQHYWASSNPPQNYWRESGSNYGIKALVHYYPGGGAGVIVKSTSRTLAASRMGGY